MKIVEVHLILILVLNTLLNLCSYSQKLVINRNGNLRSNPSVNQKIIGKVSPGMQVIQLEKKDGWYRIKLADQKEGWINSILLTKFRTVYFKTNEFHKASKENDTVKIQELISQGVDVDSRDNQKRTALHWAAENGYTNLAKLLLDAGADINVKDKWSGGNTPIEYTVFNITEWNENISKYTFDGMGNEKLWNKELFHILLEHGAVVQPERLLLHAVPSNDTLLLDFIINNWKISLPKNDGIYVYEAVCRGAHESLKWLIKHGAEINQQQIDPSGFTPLHIAVMNANIKSIEILLNAGASKSLNIKDNYGRTPIDFAKDEKIYSLIHPDMPKINIYDLFPKDWPLPVFLLIDRYVR
jgi:ankyrin repeat protein